MIINKQLAKNYKNRLNWVVVIVRQIWRFFEPQCRVYVCVYTLALVAKVDGYQSTTVQTNSHPVLILTCNF